MMTQAQEEYEIRRGETVYQLTVHYAWINYPVDHEGCPIMPPHAPLLAVDHADVTGFYLDGELEIWEMPARSTCPVLSPPMNAAEVQEFEEHLCDCEGERW